MEQRLIAIGVGLAAIIGALTLYFGDPAISPLFPPCPFYWLTGLWCPGCGSARGAHALLHGDIVGALDLNPLMVISLPFLGYAAVSRLLSIFREKTLARIFIAPFWGWFVVSVVIIYWVVRNIPLYPFTVLAP